MELTRHRIAEGARWAVDGCFLPLDLSLRLLLELPRSAMLDVLPALATNGQADGALLAPLDPTHEVWASEVTYQRSRDARKAESVVRDVYDMVYEAERPEIFFKARGWRVVDDGATVHIRRDSTWDVPEAELVLVINRHMEVVGYTAGNDLSPRSIEGQNPLYLAQAKIHDSACAIGPRFVLAEAHELADLPVSLSITREGIVAFQGTTRTLQMKRRFDELLVYLGRELSFPYGVLLMTGTGIVPSEEFTLLAGDTVEISVGACTLTNHVGY